MSSLSIFYYMAHSHHGFIISFIGCPVIWKLQLQTEIALSSSEIDYMGLSYTLCDAIPMINLLNKVHADIHCCLFEDNSGVLEMAWIHKFWLRTKHLNVKLHHFCSYIKSGQVLIHPFDMTQQLAIYFTKPINASTTA